MLEALVSFFPEDSSEGVAAIRTSGTQRQNLAQESQEAYCDHCQATNREIWSLHETRLKKVPVNEESKDPLPHLSFKYSPPPPPKQPEEAFMAQDEVFMPHEEVSLAQDQPSSLNPEEVPLNQEEAAAEEPGAASADDYSHLPSKSEIVAFKSSMHVQLWCLDLLIITLIIVIIGTSILKT
jgi:hypothetical protein